MIIGIPADKEDKNSPVSGSFGRAPFYFIYNDETNEVEFAVNDAAKAQGGAGVKAASLIVEKKVDTIITPQLGENASMVIKAANIKMYQSKEGSLMDNVLYLKDGKLEQLGNIHEGFHKS
ncbi:MAG: NifB/NifX family molybdenum-iron cluster-binding protein [Gudongella sp.]|nr:NifB/NifX family molybdenum-iron cluster-binding protein [Gudongella sp.]